jgi:hypothetical protein
MSSGGSRAVLAIIIWFAAIALCAVVLKLADRGGGLPQQLPLSADF